MFLFQILYTDTCFTAQALVRLYVDLNEKNLEMLDNGRGEGEPRFEDVAATLQLLGNELATTRQLLEVGATCLVVRSEAFLHDGACALNTLLA
jgi:hypothetical protein